MLNLANLRSTSQYWKTRAVVDKYRRYVVSQAKANLTRGRIVRGKKASYKATSKLHGSIKGYIDKKQKRSIKGKFNCITSIFELYLTISDCIKKNTQ